MVQALTHPIFEHHPIYLVYSATTPLDPAVVVSAMRPYLEQAIGAACDGRADLERISGGNRDSVVLHHPAVWQQDEAVFGRRQLDYLQLEAVLLGNCGGLFPV
jgi:hypothetical protein